MPNTQVYLVALQVTGDGTRAEMEEVMRGMLPRPGKQVGAAHLECWWVAEDDRNDGSDNDSAVFVRPGKAHTAWRILEAADLSSIHNEPLAGGQFGYDEGGLGDE
jgi:hypothetical protein